MREAEERASAAEVGVGEVEFLGHPDGVVEYGIPLRRDIALAIRAAPARKWSLTINHRDTWGGTAYNMADHRHVGLAVVDAVRDAANRWVFADDRARPVARCARWCWSSGSPEPTHFVDVTDTSSGASRRWSATPRISRTSARTRASSSRRSAAAAGRRAACRYATTFEVLAP